MIANSNDNIDDIRDNQDDNNQDDNNRDDNNQNNNDKKVYEEDNEAKEGSF